LDFAASHSLPRFNMQIYFWDLQVPTETKHAPQRCCQPEAGA
jgi:hypothetical protein